MSYYTKLKDRKTWECFLLCEKLEINNWLFPLKMQVFRRHRESPEWVRTKMINENGTSFCKRIDENSGINYLWKNTVKKVQFGNKVLTESRVEAENEK